MGWREWVKCGMEERCMSVLMEGRFERWDGREV